jgi:hypothetical protein
MEGVDRSCLRMGLRSLPYIEKESYIVHRVLRQVLVFHSQEVDLINYLVGEDEIGAACVDNCWNQASQEQRERARICRLLRNTSILARLPTASSIIHHLPSPSPRLPFTPWLLRNCAYHLLHGPILQCKHIIVICPCHNLTLHLHPWLNTILGET